jgi:hypothetical protein
VILAKRETNFEPDGGGADAISIAAENRSSGKVAG